MIDLNPDLNLLPTQIGIQLGIFFASYTVLNKVLYKPYLELAKARQAKSTDLKAQTEHQKEETIKFQTEYDAFMKKERKDISHWTEEEKKKVADEERSIIEAARNKVAKELAESQKQAEEQLSIARKELMPTVGELSSKIVAKLTGKKVTIAAGASSNPKELEETL